MTVDIEQILKDYRGWLWKVALGMTRDIERQKDVVQAGRIAMWRALETFDSSKGALPSHLTKAARWKMQEEAWGRHRTRGVKLDDVPMEDIDLEEMLESSDLLAGVEEAYHQGQIMEAISRLSPEQKEYVYRRFWKDETEPQIRVALGKQNPVHYLWTDQRNGARKQLAESLNFLQEVS